MKVRVLLAILIVGLMSCATWLFPPPALALTDIKLFDIAYEDCPSELSDGMVASGSSMEATCYMITGKAENNSGNPVIDADVFGRVYDANNNPVMQNRSRLGLIPEVPPGVSDFEIRISVPSNMPAPLKLEKFKSVGFTSKVRR